MNQANRLTFSLADTGVSGHDQHHVAEVRFATIVVGQHTVIHHLQQQVEDIRVCFLYLIQQHHRMRMLNHRIRQQAALIKADVTRRRTNQTADGVTLHILGHIKAQQLNPQCFRQLHGDFRFTHTGRPGKQEGTNGLTILTQTCTAHFDRFRQRLNGVVLTKHQHLQAIAQIFQRIAVAC